MKFLLRLSIIFFLTNTILFPQRKVDINKLHSRYVLAPQKVKRKKELLKNIRRYANAIPTHRDYKEWIELLYDIEATFFNTPETRKIISSVLHNFTNVNEKLLYAGFETATAVFPNAFTGIIDSVFSQTANPNIFIVSANYLLVNKYKKRNSSYYVSETEKRFANWEKVPQLYLFHQFLQKSKTGRLKEIPDLTGLFSHEYQSGKTIIFSIFRKNRKYPGLTIIRKPDGKFLRDENGEIFHIKQLGLSFADLPGFIPNGNTPQGIFSIVGWYITPTESIGPTPNVLTRLPFEIPVDEFLHNPAKKKNWTLEVYKNLLPDEWKDYLPFYETFYAGKASRKLLIMHGSTDDLEYYENKPYFPLTPTRGCLSSAEIWDEETGKCIRSDQAKLMNAFFSTDVLEGFLVVIEINDKDAPVKLEDIKEMILKSEEGN